MAKACLKMALLLFLMASYCMSLSKASIVIHEGIPCASEADCRKVHYCYGQVYCIQNHCACRIADRERQEDSAQIMHKETSVRQDASKCQNDKDCKAICPPNCKSTNCMNGTCFCSC
ncbi:putative defensin-like protein 263 [Ricinus communis]|uniref:putative defensin-like protein 263 n=1 Tax=Ricinus communis TaxID=3988 RepID=UPI00201AFF38|nr:putative defensin-like protein 263 [Ricinus communis]